MHFDLFIGIDYSGAATASSRLRALQVYTARVGQEPKKQCSPVVSPTGQPRNWSRKAVAEWLIELAQKGVRYIAGIDHGFSFPQSYFDRYRLTSWPQFLEDFVYHWPTDREHMSVEFCRHGTAYPSPDWPGSGLRIGAANELRLCERWTSSAKSVFQFDMQGSVANSTHAGLPWLKRIRDALDERIHVWPFDGWQMPETKFVLAEVYPSILRNRYPRTDRTPDEHDAYAVARWLADCAGRGILAQYFDPPLSADERHVADREGWIMGIR